MSTNTTELELRVHAITYEARSIRSFDLRPTNGSVLPPFQAGAHIDIHLPSGLVRSYSLLNAEAERHRYLIAVNKEVASRGGSSHMHDGVRVGDILRVGGPRNNFSLAEGAPQSVFFAGGIGITPIWSMIQRLEVLGEPWKLYYSARSREDTALLDRLEALPDQANIHLNFDFESGKMFDIPALVAEASPDTHFYCCGPKPMLAAFESATAAQPPHAVHLEYFAATEAPATEGGFTVVLARSGLTIEVPPSKTILEAVLDAGVPATSSCREGICAACETRVLEGVPDHRDLVLSREERAANQVMMICCSGSKSSKLVLDL